MPVTTPLNHVALSLLHTNSNIQCRVRDTGTFYKCKVVSVKKKGRGFQITLHKHLDATHLCTKLSAIDNIQTITNTEAHSPPLAWTPTNLGNTETHSPPLAWTPTNSPPLPMYTPPVTRLGNTTPLNSTASLNRLGKLPLPDTRSIEIANNHAYIHIQDSPSSPVKPVQMVCIHGRLQQCPQCAALNSKKPE